MSDLLLSERISLQQLHLNHSKRALITPLSGTVRAIEVWEFGNILQWRRIYGFDINDKVIVVVEIYGSRPEIAPILAKCRNTQPWYWHVNESWLPVGNIPAGTDPNPTPNSFQNGDGQTVNGVARIPNAWAQTRSNGNKVAIWDVLWTPNLGVLERAAPPSGTENKPAGQLLDSLSLEAQDEDTSEQPDPFV